MQRAATSGITSFYIVLQTIFLNFLHCQDNNKCWCPDLISVSVADCIIGPNFSPLPLSWPLLCNFSPPSQRGQVYFLTSWLWVWTCDWIWPLEWGRNEPVTNLGLKSPWMFLLIITCLYHIQEKSMPGLAFWPQENEWPVENGWPALGKFTQPSSDSTIATVYSQKNG